jgi:hypothetical protein
VCILLGISPASDCDLPTFRNLLSVPSSKAGCRVLYTQPLKKRRHITLWRRGNTQNNTHNMQNTAKVWNQQVVTTSVVYITITDICNNEKPGSCSWYSDCAMGWMIQGWIPCRDNGFPVLQNVQTRSGAHPGSCWMCTGCLFPGAHWNCWRMKLRIVLHLTMTGALPQFCLCAFVAWSGTNLTLPVSLLIANSITFFYLSFT